APVRDERLAVVPGDFEYHTGDACRGWRCQDDPGAGPGADTSVVHGGRTSLRVENRPGVWGEGGGRLWMDDLVIDEAPLVNVVRRPGCPLVVRCDDGRKLEEGVHFRPVRDERMHELADRGDFEVYHDPPVIELLPAAALADGAIVRASFHHAVSIYGGQVAASLSEPEVFAWFEHQVEGVARILAPRRWFLSHDEIRVANWSAPEIAAGRTAGDVLAANVARCAGIVRARQPEAGLCVWSDMFDPHHNARDAFYLVNGTLAGSWEGSGGTRPVAAEARRVTAPRACVRAPSRPSAPSRRPRG
ncbi:MAG: hypothetical protein ACKOES_15270, partial [Planctomycetaceae bacterium]